MKKILRRLLFLILTIISITVIYTYGYRAVFVFLSSRSVKLERSIDFSGTGQGITWMQEGAAKTLFFIPSSEESAVEDLYGSWLRELYTAQGVNIIVPPFDGLLNRPDLRGDSYDPRSRDRDVLFLFNLYSAMVGKKHEITVMSTGDGSLQAL
ncbi:MAG: hypothetical protein JXR86_11640, partial [Spirochaetales bacterium]|nr:hypothetical protein [Spirochaetales bacterium]